MQKVYNIKELAELISNFELSFDLSQKKTEEVLVSLIKVMYSHLKKEDKIKLNKLGTFEVKERVGRKCISPKDNITEIFVKPVRVVKFNSSYTLKNYIRGRNQ